MPGTRTNSRDNAGHMQGVLRDAVRMYNQAVLDLELARDALSADVLLFWTSGCNSTVDPMCIGSTDTQIGTGAMVFSIAGARTAKAQVAAGTAIGAQTIPADKWGVYALDIASNGTITISAGAANTTGYSTEALALVAIPYPLTAQARVGVVTVKTKASTAWIAATDGLAGGSSGNVASATNYYPSFGAWSPTGNRNFVGGANGIRIPTVLAIGSSDTNVSSTAFTFNANGIVNLAKAAVTAGTALGALGTVPANTWGLIVAYISAIGTITFQSAPNNYTSGYATEAAAKADLGRVTKPTGLARMGYFTVQASTSAAWIAGTDALAGGTTGNEAQTTNYYPQGGSTSISTTPVQAGFLASQIGTGPSLTVADLTEDGVSVAITTTGI